jgi:hypothetical protein
VFAADLLREQPGACIRPVKISVEVSIEATETWLAKEQVEVTRPAGERIIDAAETHRNRSLGARAAYVSQ